MRRGVLSVSAVLVVSLLPALPAAAAPLADKRIATSLRGVRSVIPDLVHQRLYAADGRSPGVVTAFDDQGVALATVTGLATPVDQALSADANTLYVLLAGSTQVVAFDSATLAEQGRLSLGVSCPASISATATTLWFGYGCAGSGGHLGAVALDSTTFAASTVTTDIAVSGFTPSSAPYLDTNPNRPGDLLASPTAYADRWLYILDIQGVSPTVRVYRGPDHNPIGYGGEATFSPNGERVLSAYGARFRAADLGADGYIADSALAESPDGTRMAAADQTTLTLWTSAGHQYRVVPEPDTSRWPSIGLHAMAWLSNPDWLYVFDRDPSQDYAVTLWMVRDPAKPLATISLPAAQTIGMDKAPNLVGRLNADLDAPTTVTVTHSPTFGAPETTVVPVAADGSFDLSQPLHTRGVHTFAVRFDGDAKNTAALTTVRVTVTGLTPYLTIRSPQPTSGLNFGQALTVSTHLGTTHTNRSVRIVIEGRAHVGAGTTLSEGPVNSSGDRSVSTRATIVGNYLAVFTGDDRYLPRTVKSPANVRTITDSRLFGNYSVSGSDRLYHLASNPVFGVAAAPAIVNARGSFTIDVLTNGHWEPFAGGDAALNSDGEVYVKFTLRRKVGQRFRIKATVYNNGYFLPGYTPYSYFRFTS